ncbi:YeeE/YedE family protein [Macrococcus equipercicus]|uniref:YeeE/YedE family protein n=1 Tax=Macrococcus equipercicus TaxID=69967 RepID=A0ABQ6RA70_9STAP|nr:YeeE/YedE family protein [Macrococcus equipercicus]KAA1040168.1 YeeE/YedE family protein [Macrococcus equipercicus]
MIWTIISGLIVGALLGFVMQRTRFCLTGGFRDMYVQKSNKMFYALLIAITIQSIGLLILSAAGVYQLSYEAFPVVGTIIGSFVFGVGIILAGGCATGTWYRAGEGLIGSWIALFMYALSASATKFGFLKPVLDKINSKTVVSSSMTETTGIPFWVFVVVLAAVTLFFVNRSLSKKSAAVPQLKQRYTGIRHYLFEKRYHTFTAAVVIGLIALLAWPMSISTGRVGGLGITTPSAKLVQFITTGNVSLLDWGVFLVLGIVAGSYIAAKGSREFRWRLPDIKTIRNSVIGGVMMGFGASMAGGCSIGNGMVATATMSWQGWLSLVFMILGTWFMSYFVFVRPMQQYKKSAKTKAVAQTA